MCQKAPSDNFEGPFFVTRGPYFSHTKIGRKKTFVKTVSVCLNNSPVSTFSLILTQIPEKCVPYSRNVLAGSPQHRENGEKGGGGGNCHRKTQGI